MSHPGYPRLYAVHEIATRLRRMTRESVHEFWPDDVSALDEAVLDSTRIHGPRQLMDIYLLALAVQKRGVLVTFDRSIAISAVYHATERSLIVL